eukprot:1158360-Pelagomonas_calceolata.AAC.3
MASAAPSQLTWGTRAGCHQTSSLRGRSSSQERAGRSTGGALVPAHPHFGLQAGTEERGYGEHGAHLCAPADLQFWPEEGHRENALNI